MTIDQFNKTSFYSGLKVSYDGRIFDVVSVDFEEALIGIQEIEGSDELQWKRCENCEIIKN